MSDNPLSRLLALTPFAGERPPRVSILRLEGVIAADARTRKALSLARIEKTIEAAFKPKGLSAVALSVNSPGGSPVQSRLILDRIRALAEEKKTPVVAFVEDVGASGGYMLALAGDEIYADDSSIVGSIGVVSAGFGLNRAIARFGIERRAYTAGEKKLTLDPFQPEDPEETARLKAVLKALHDVFIGLVRERRGDRLKGADAELFSGEFFVAGEAVARGLIDGIGHVRPFMKARFGPKTRFKTFSAAEGRGLLKLLGGGARASAPADLVEALGENLAWSRYGL